MLKNARVILVDNRKDGHHSVYLNSLLKINGSSQLVIEKKFSSKKNFLFYFIDRYIYLKKIIYIIINKNSSTKIINFLYLDDLITPLWLLVNKHKFVFIGVLHQVPISYLKRKILTIMAKKLDFIVVHSEEIRKELNSIKIYNSYVVSYPNFLGSLNKLEKIKFKSNLNIPNDKIVFTLLGSTRHDKGLDIFLKSLDYLSQNLRKKIYVNIAGDSDYFKEDYIENTLKKLNVSNNIHLEFLTKETYKLYLGISDFIVIPYRNEFKGLSGPLIEALDNSIFCIVSNLSQFTIYEKLSNKILFFEKENSIDLSKKLTIAIDNFITFQFEETNLYSTDIFSEHKFLNRYKDLYKTVMEDFDV